MSHVGMEGDESNGGLLHSSTVSRRSRKMRRLADLCDDVSVSAPSQLQLTGSPAPSRPAEQKSGDVAAASGHKIELTGSVAMGKVGQTVGPMDIGECDDSYMFRVSLPGVKRDESEFSCEVSYDGKVSIRGVTTTGENTVNRFSQKFEMLSQNLCPPGHFSIYFQLPGPVNPHEFTGSFGTDGILEGIVMKKREE